MTQSIARPRAFSVKEAQRMLGVSAPTMYKLVRQPHPPFRVVKVGTHYRIPAGPFLEWLNTNDAEHSADTHDLTSNAVEPIRRSIRFKKNGDPIDPTKYYRKGERAILGADLIDGTW